MKRSNHLNENFKRVYASPKGGDKKKHTGLYTRQAFRQARPLGNGNTGRPLGIKPAAPR